MLDRLGCKDGDHALCSGIVILFRDQSSLTLQHYWVNLTEFLPELDGVAHVQDRGIPALLKTHA
jgi:hypothetical protein